MPPFSAPLDDFKKASRQDKTEDGSTSENSHRWRDYAAVDGAAAACCCWWWCFHAGRSGYDVTAEVSATGSSQAYSIHSLQHERKVASYSRGVGFPINIDIFQSWTCSMKRRKWRRLSFDDHYNFPIVGSHLQMRFHGGYEAAHWNVCPLWPPSAVSNGRVVRTVRERRLIVIMTTVDLFINYNDDVTIYPESGSERICENRSTFGEDMVKRLCRYFMFYDSRRTVCE